MKDNYIIQLWYETASCAEGSEATQATSCKPGLQEAMHDCVRESSVGVELIIIHV